MSDAESRVRAHDAYDQVEERFNEALDESLHPAGPDLLYEYVAEMGLPRLLEPAEAAFLLPVMGCYPEAMSPGLAEAAISGAGLRFDQCRVLGAEWGEYASERSPAPGRHLLHAARLLPEPGGYTARFAEQNYDIKLGDCLWHTYRMIGKLSGRVYVLSARD